MEPIEQPIMLEVPGEMETERLTMRPPRPGDGKRINAVVRESVAEVGQWMPWANPMPEPEATEKWCREAASKFISREALHYVLRLKDADETILGACGIHRFDWTVPAFEIGYWLRTSHCGRGYMTEAVGRLVRMAFDNLGANRVEIRCDQKNHRSARVAERLGFHSDGVLRCDARGAAKELRDTRIYSMVRADLNE
ncbi:MAG TPA: GNAT family N-acetyltransferase [Tepidisphaeraceae bacterium]|nr:GNAT family N-acetyltransferase [Tepidisphaeraceae bacterium]